MMRKLDSRPPSGGLDAGFTLAFLSCFLTLSALVGSNPAAKQACRRVVFSGLSVSRSVDHFATAAGSESGEHPRSYRGGDELDTAITAPDIGAARVERIDLIM
jgi:hypothetical protein